MTDRGIPSNDERETDLDFPARDADHDDDEEMRGQWGPTADYGEDAPGE